MAKRLTTGSGAHPPDRMVRIPAGEFKAKCLKILDDVRARRHAVMITKYGKPVAKLVPTEDEVPDSFGALQGSVRYHGDIVAPDHDAWDEAPR